MSDWYMLIMAWIFSLIQDYLFCLQINSFSMQDSNLLLYINGSIVFDKNRQKWNWSLVPKIVLVTAFAFKTTFLNLINITKAVYQDL